MNLSKEEINRYSRHIQLEEVGQTGQEKLKKASILVVGAGGLGCPVLQYLAAAGIGSLGIVDYDIVQESNLQRQILFNTSLIGKNKAQAAKEQIQKLNPFVVVKAYAEKLTPTNAVSFFEQYDVIVDATDNFESRYLINDAALLTNKPFVSGAIHRFEGQVSILNYNNGPTYRCLFPTLPQAAAIPNCEEVGVLGVLPGIVGTYQANEVLKIIIGIGQTLSGKLMLINTLTNSSSLIQFQRNEEEINKVIARGRLSESSIQEISATELYQRINQGESFNFLDVRKAHEQPKIEELRGSIDPNKKLPLVVYCQSGLRSKRAIQELQQEGFTKLYNLTGGIKTWLTEVESKNILTETE